MAALDKRDVGGDRVSSLVIGFFGLIVDAG
jgi:hypothetical protein